MSVSRQKKVYLPTATRKNQYITVGFTLTDELLASYSDLTNCYQEFSKLVFKSLINMNCLMFMWLQAINSLWCVFTVRLIA